MKQTIEICTCDICKKECEVTTIKYPVLFTTSQTDGAYVGNYISYNDIDMCKECQDKAINLIGWGANGFNSYEFRHRLESEAVEN